MFSYNVASMAEQSSLMRKKFLLDVIKILSLLANAYSTWIWHMESLPLPFLTSSSLPIYKNEVFAIHDVVTDYHRKVATYIR